MSDAKTLPPLLDHPRPAHLVLADGSVFNGWAAGAKQVVEGEVVFNTSMTGYQEMFSDPSYHGQILVLTTSHVGQVGSNAQDAESDRIWARSVVVQHFDLEPSSWRSEQSLPMWLEAQGISIGWGFDTRSIVRHVRWAGAVPGVLATDGSPAGTLLERARTARGTDGCDLASEVACSAPYQWTEGLWTSPSMPSPAVLPAAGLRIAVVDFGIKRSILRQCAALGFEVRVVPPTTDPATLLDGAFDGVLLSNGPGDPSAVVGATALIEAVLGRLPVLGICLGHQLLGLALGGRTVKLPFGHHGGNHPVRELATGRVLITSQNHNYAVDESSLPREIELTHINLTDGTVEGLSLPRLNVEAVQFHPEASPGPNDATAIFTRFAERCREARS